MADPNPSYKLLLPLLRRHRKAVIVFVAVILTSLAIEGLGVGAVISMLDAWGDGGIVDRIPHQKSQHANQQDKPQQHQPPIVALVFGTFRATVGALSFEGGRTSVAEAGRVAES